MLYVASIFYDIIIHVIRASDVSRPIVYGSSSSGDSLDRLIEIGFISNSPGKLPHYVSLLREPDKGKLFIFCSQH